MIRIAALALTSLAMFAAPSFAQCYNSCGVAAFSAYAAPVQVVRQRLVVAAVPAVQVQAVYAQQVYAAPVVQHVAFAQSYSVPVLQPAYVQNVVQRQVVQRNVVQRVQVQQRSVVRTRTVVK